MDTDTSSWRLLNIHGYLALLAFVVILPISTILVTLGRRWEWWLIGHITAVLAGVVLIVISTVMAYMGSPDGHFVTVHQRTGAALLLAMIVQVCLGLYISTKWKAARRTTPIRDRLHWWLGRLIVVSSFAVCFHGYVLAGWDVPAFAITVACWFLWILIYGILLIIYE